MAGRSVSWLRRLAQLPLGGRVAVLMATMLVAYALSLPIAYCLDGTTGVVAAATALAICLLGGFTALLVCELLQKPELILYRVLVGMLLRMGLPLGLMLVVYYRGGPLVDAGLAYYVVGFYLVMLAIETVLLVPDGRASGGSVR